MIIPPFPPQDLAKLVLGYLAEEQLMTAYDEFLQASPYLDALRNEYDRIFMTSLKNILAEYRAVKIYVETCKPYSLRRRLFGCTNLLEVVKFLIKHVDCNKIQDGQAILDSRNSTDRSSVCAVCNSLKLDSCMCKSRHSKISLNKSSSLKEESALESSVETTSLQDLPGHHVTTRKKQVRTLPKESKVTQSSYSSDVNTLYPSTDSTSMAHPDPTLLGHTHTSQVHLDNNRTLVPNNDFPVNMIPPQSTQTLDEANNYKAAGYNNTIHQSENNFGHPTIGRVSMAGTFQDFSNGVKVNEKVNLVVPDSNTPDNMNLPASAQKEHIIGTEANNSTAVANSKPNGSKAHIFLTVGTIKTSQTSDSSRPNSPLMSFAGNLRPKTCEQKVTILSDIKVDKTFNSENSNMPAVLKNATSTPLMHMQTILINGTTAYKQQPQIIQHRNFTKDEIMAMPTIIVVPTSGQSEVPASISSETVTSQLVNSSVSTASSTGLGPLVIDVTSQSPVSRKQNTCSTNIPKLIPETLEKGAGMLVKTVELKNVSLPKDSTDTLNKGTPLVLPPTRKSSSTPRRTSHVRVLDFTTPRRILQEAILEHNMENPSTETEVIISKSPNLNTFAKPNTENTIENDDIEKGVGVANSSGSSKENDNTVQGVSTKRHNWDADLRALAVTNKKEDIPKSCIMPRCRPKSKTAKKPKLSTIEKKANAKVSVENVSISTKNKQKTSKSKRKSQEILEEAEVIVEETASVPVKPTINIISGSDWNHAQETDQKQNKSNNDDETETPELDRLSLQNAIGAKLNISDLLETPYKQALYDIQMETPRFLGPDLPDEPLSDIKIMNIPTPRFLNTPKPIQATPSSYSSRPTDYSSGGSYYKPDDLDYMRVEDLGYPPSVPKDKETVNATNEEAKSPKAKTKRSKSNNSKLSRPVRKCAKNVSYYRNHLNKSSEGDDKSEAASSCSEPIDNKMNKDAVSKTVRQSKTKSITETNKKRDSDSKKRKSPMKKESHRAFMKIKPRRITPTKESAKTKRTPEGQGRKRTTSKDKKVNVTPVIVSAPTKSRRKSSTPRKIHCTKTFNTESYGNESPETVSKPVVIQESSLSCAQDSDTEQLPLRWSDDGSQDVKSKEPHDVVCTGSGTYNNEAEDITKIKEYIASELQNATANASSNDRGSNLHIDLVNRGFDIETAKIIERDLLDTPPHVKENIVNVSSELIVSKENEAPLNKTVASDSSSNSKSVQDDVDDDGEIELSVSDCNEESANFITCCHDDLKNIPKGALATLKDKFSMEVCIDDGVAIRLRATPLTIILDEEPKEEKRPDYYDRETEMAVNSISNIDKLYTPMKDSIRAQVYDIFDSTLTSLDTPLKTNSPKRKECDTTVTEIVLEVEKIELKSEVKPRKRLNSADSDDAVSEPKRSKPEAQYLLNSANIQNIDIETVLSKLHGP
ncbi:uncharacterized protein LOC126369489 [Pectinophora gossypiella]|uniref:uncharacterized protein LOC126369489 n=1 Tax=Pectinophora gossypiella TaxID=13191 RepID=UPI00214E12C4|nr:uncharacterized protein LOC126369489 [Pectinophora gossypiella]